MTSLLPELILIHKWGSNSNYGVGAGRRGIALGKTNGRNSAPSRPHWQRAGFKGETGGMEGHLFGEDPGPPVPPLPANFHNWNCCKWGSVGEEALRLARMLHLAQDKEVIFWLAEDRQVAFKCDAPHYILRIKPSNELSFRTESSE